MTRPSEIARLRRILQSRRRSLLESEAATQNEVDALEKGERDPEAQESAQVSLANYTLSHLVESHRNELMQIDAALERVEVGLYGLCVDCSQPIPIDRLEALPFALRCEEDAERYETEQRSAGELATPSL